MTIIDTTWGVQEVATAIAEAEYICGLINGLVAGQPALVNALIPLQVLRERLNIGGVIKPIRTIVSDDIFTENDYTVIIDASVNTVDLLFPANPNHGQIFNAYCKDSTFACSVSGNGKNINGSASSKALLVTEAITAQYDEDYGWIIF